MQQLFRSFPAILDEFEQNEQVDESLVFAAWRRAAGDLLCERSAPVAFSDKRLVVAVTDVTWRRHLIDLSAQMIFKLNAALGPGHVAFLEFRIDEKAVSRKKIRMRPAAEAVGFDAIAPDLMKAAEAIKSDALRTQFLRTANAYLEKDAKKKKD